MSFGLIASIASSEMSMTSANSDIASDKEFVTKESSRLSAGGAKYNMTSLKTSLTGLFSTEIPASSNFLLTSLGVPENQ